ncbi:hypothetical protein [Nocardioides sp.]|jgi:hypothetical protein|uniref:hypothetical protein n=1 Tax=Nocardioides sp. TaxID=35761 RepID=UPI002F428113
MMSSRFKIAVATIAGLVILSASGAEARGPRPAGPVRVDLSASAHPIGAGNRYADTAHRVNTVRGVTTHAATTATASAICRGCSAEAISVQVLYLDRSPTMRLDNVAIAWTQGCASCNATAVSLQVVVVSRPGSLITANRAAALNAACNACHATSGAFQLVVSGKAQSRFSATTLRSLTSWASTQALLLRTPDLLGLSHLQQRLALKRLAHLVNADLGTRTLGARARVSGQ